MRLGWVALITLVACAETRGSRWMAEPLPPIDLPPLPGAAPPRVPAPRAVRDESQDAPAQADAPRVGRSLGTFRNTYYDFPREESFTGAKVSLRSADCTEIAAVARGFHDAVCVQGSGRLARGATVSFAKRDCACAEICPRTSQKICFEALDPVKFPFGRGSLGQAITPLVTVAVDAAVVDLGTPLYVPAFAGIAPEEGASPLDGCFRAEDRGIRVRGNHVDVFTGDPRVTARLNGLVPSNQGVEVFVDAPACARLRR